MQMQLPNARHLLQDKAGEKESPNTNLMVYMTDFRRPISDCLSSGGVFATSSSQTNGVRAVFFHGVCGHANIIKRHPILSQPDILGDRDENSRPIHPLRQLH
jgi:hypothetical protein